MAYDPGSKMQTERLIKAIRHSRKLLRPFREQRSDAVKQFVGKHYGENGAPDKVPVNLLELAISIYIYQLAARHPRASVSTPHASLRAMARNSEIAADHLMSEIKFGRTLQRGVRDAMFGVGVFKLGLTRGRAVEVDDVMFEMGQPYADTVDMDDLVLDMQAKRWEQMCFIGNRYRMSVDEVRKNEWFDSKVRDIEPMEDSGKSEDGDEQVRDLSQQGDDFKDGYKDFIDLWDIYLPREQILMTLRSDSSNALMIHPKPLSVIHWDGPEHGPYHVLSFTEVPENLMPLAPAAVLMDLHDLCNRLFRKLGRQAERQKTVVGVAAGADEDGNRILNAADGEMIRLDHPEKTQEYRFGGPDQVNLAMFLQGNDLFNRFAGNLDALGGLSPQADTLGQDQLLTASASKRLESMQAAVVEVTTAMMRDLMFWMWEDPTYDPPLTKRIEGTDIEIPVAFSPDDREGDFFDYNFSINPYSMQGQTPGQKLGTLNQILQTTLIPMLPMMQQQGIGINVHELMNLYAKWGNIDELQTILTFADPEMGQQGEGPIQPPKSPVSTRTTIRRNIPGASRSGKDHAMMTALMGIGQQPSERQAIGRPTG